MRLDQSFREVHTASLRLVVTIREIRAGHLRMKCSEAKYVDAGVDNSGSADRNGRGKKSIGEEG